MKPLKRAMLLSIMIMAIIVFWLAPGINSAKHRSYVRYYEDTDLPAKDIAFASDTTVKKKTRKVYKKEVIEPSKTKEVSGKMFSRVAQFRPVETPADTLKGEIVVLLDSSRNSK
jgi:hypothetical protein